MTRIFITGSSGYVGGNTLSLLTQSHPEWEIVALVRCEKHRMIIEREYPLVSTVVGDLDDVELMVRCASSADIVVQLASAENLTTTKALLGLDFKPKENPKKLYIQLAGIASLQNTPQGYGSSSPIRYNDKSTTTLPTNTFPRGSIESSIMLEEKKAGVQTAIICPGVIYGIGKGPIRRRGIRIPHLIESILKRRRGFTVGKGENEMSLVHIDDVSSAIITLIESSLILQPPRPTPEHLLFDDSFFFLHNQSAKSLFSITTLIIQTILLCTPPPPHSLLPKSKSKSKSKSTSALTTTAIEHLTAGQAAQIHPWAPILWGTNSVGDSHPSARLRQLGWVPKGESLEDVIGEMVKVEVERLEGLDRDDELVWAWRVDVGKRDVGVIEDVACCF